MEEGKTKKNPNQKGKKEEMEVDQPLKSPAVTDAKSVDQWSIDEVYGWAKVQTDEEEANKLRTQKVNGRALLTLTKDDLLKEPYKILGGPASNLAEAIEKLKTPIAPPQAINQAINQDKRKNTSILGSYIFFTCMNLCIKILYVIGIGKKSRVFSARIQGGPRIALKLYQYDNYPKVNPFEREKYMLEHLQGMKGVQQLHYCGVDDDSYVWGLITGPVGLSLDILMNRDGRPFPVKDTMEIATQLVETLYSLHQKGIAHRDIKPANIIRSRHEHRFYLIDFGLACCSEDSEEWKSTNCGTLLFMPVINDGNNAKNDMESLVYTLVYLVLGFAPWEIDEDQPFAITSMTLAKANFHGQHSSIFKKLQLYKVDETLENFLSLCISTFTG